MKLQQLTFIVSLFVYPPTTKSEIPMGDRRAFVATNEIRSHGAYLNNNQHCYIPRLSLNETSTVIV